MSACSVRVGVNQSTLVGPDEAVHLASEALTVKDPKAKFTKAGRFGGWDGCRRLLRRPGNHFDTGLLDRVVRALEAGGHRVAVIRQEIPRRDPLCPPPAITWRPYQLDALKLTTAPGARLVLQAPTASGKTNIGVETARRLGGRGLWVVHTKALFEQTYAQLREKLPGAQIGRVGDGKFQLGAVTLGIVASLKNDAGREGQKAAPYFQEFDWLIEDEAHHGGAETWVAVAKACSRAWTKIGLSGTATAVKDPVRAMSLEGALGPIHVLTDAATLVDQGFLARPLVHFLRPPAESYLSYEQVRAIVLPDWKRDPTRLMRMGSQLYAVAYDRNISGNQRRNQIALGIAKQHVLAGDRVLLLCRLVGHAKHLHAWWRKYCALPSWQLDGRPESSRLVAPTLDAFRRSSGGLLICTPFFREGVDVPEIDSYINAAAGEAEGDLLQALGRALRPRPDKSEVRVYDFWDGGADTEKPEKDYSLNHSSSRLSYYRKQGYQVTGAGA